MPKFVSKLAQRYSDNVGKDATIAALRTVPNIVAIVVLLKRAYRLLPARTQDSLNGRNRSYRRQARNARRSLPMVKIKTPVFSGR